MPLVLVEQLELREHPNENQEAKGYCMSSLDRLTASECGQVSKIAAKRTIPKAAKSIRETLASGYHANTIA